jgi:hypothetical protein
LAFGEAVAVFDRAAGAGLRFLAFRAGAAPAAGTGVVFPDVSPAEEAVHSAGRNQIDWHCRRDFSFGRFHYIQVLPVGLGPDVVSRIQ